MNIPDEEGAYRIKAEEFYNLASEYIGWSEYFLRLEHEGDEFSSLYRKMSIDHMDVAITCAHVARSCEIAVDRYRNLSRLDKRREELDRKMKSI